MHLSLAIAQNNSDSGAWLCLANVLLQRGQNEDTAAAIAGSHLARRGGPVYPALRCDGAACQPSNECRRGELPPQISEKIGLTVPRFRSWLPGTRYPGTKLPWSQYKTTGKPLPEGLLVLENVCAHFPYTAADQLTLHLAEGVPQAIRDLWFRSYWAMTLLSSTTLPFPAANMTVKSIWCRERHCGGKIIATLDMRSELDIQMFTCTT